MKTFQTSIKTKHPTKADKKNTRWKHPCLGEQIFFPKKVNHKGTWTNKVTPSPPPPANCKYNKERGRTLERTLGLKEASSIVISCFEIKTTCTRCNTINMFYL
jgi:hypothetical protein